MDGIPITAMDTRLDSQPESILSKSDKIGFSFEVTPLSGFQDKDSKTSNILFHPGLILRYAHGFSIIGRLAFGVVGALWSYGLYLAKR